MLTIIHGCDVGPGKGIHVCDGKTVKSFLPCQINQYIDQYAPQLIAWDSPLTGPAQPDGADLIDGDLTMRPIEQFFKKMERPEGISVLPYGGCSHWTISRRFLGLPRIGQYCIGFDKLPFQPLFAQDDLGRVQEYCRYVVEVHPAVAMWLWCRDKFPEDWEYKRNIARVKEIWERIRQCVDGADGLAEPRNGDELDSTVAWLLADRWVNEKGVMLLGDAQVGSFLVPEDNKLKEEFSIFQQKRNTKLARIAARPKDDS